MKLRQPLFFSSKRALELVLGSWTSSFRGFPDTSNWDESLGHLAREHLGVPLRISGHSEGERERLCCYDSSELGKAFENGWLDQGEKSTCARHPCVFHKGHENLLYLYALIPSFGYTLRLLRSLSE